MGWQVIIHTWLCSHYVKGSLWQCVTPGLLLRVNCFSFSNHSFLLHRVMSGPSLLRSGPFPNLTLVIVVTRMCVLWWWMLLGLTSAQLLLRYVLDTWNNSTSISVWVCKSSVCGYTIDLNSTLPLPYPLTLVSSYLAKSSIFSPPSPQSFHWWVKHSQSPEMAATKIL